jgi:glutathione synthase/RimK-type ligase-like ATP-grasp enzyme
VDTSSSTPAGPAGAPAGPILIAGGDADHSILSLRRQAMTRGFDHVTLLAGAKTHPTLTWDFATDRLELDGREIRPAACFVRHDVFTYMADKDQESSKRAAAWYTTLAGWLLVHPEVRVLNRHFANNNNKAYMLHLARTLGLEVPVTRISNDLDALERWGTERALVAKPAQGGGHCRELDEMLAQAREAGRAGPFIVQNRLVQPEVRLYYVGGRFIAFTMASDVLDYRTSMEARVIPKPLEELPQGMTEGMGRLMGALRMDYGAADFKTDPDTGRLLFLELNSSPMFFGFDLATRGAVSDAILDALVGPVQAPAAGVRTSVPAGGCKDCGAAAAAAMALAS